MTMVLCIFNLTTVPRKIRPLIDTLPVNGHFLSIYLPSIASRGTLKPKPTFRVYLNFFLGTFFFNSDGLPLRKMVGCF